MSGTTFVGVEPGHDDVMRLALTVAQLPTDDIDQTGRTFFRMADEAGVIGYVGIEGDGPDRLLRSLVVLASRRGQGHGRGMVARLEELARQDDVERLHLLTTSAAAWFRELGYRDAERSEAPDAVARSAQFASLCPASAIYLVKSL